MKHFFMSTLIVLCFCSISYGSEVSGILKLKKNHSKLIVGESYQYQLILVPFNEEDIRTKDLLAKYFLDVWYVAEVNSISVSSENADAVVVDMDLILTKNKKFDNVSYWKLGEQNIPVEVRIAKISDTKLNKKEFTLLENFYELPMDLSWSYLVLSLLLIIVGFLMIFWRGRKAKQTKEVKEDFLSLLSSAKTHSDLEKLYLQRREILVLAERKGKGGTVKLFFNSYGNMQYEKSWHERDISNITKEANELAQEISSGV